MLRFWKNILYELGDSSAMLDSNYARYWLKKGMST